MVQPNDTSITVENLKETVGRFVDERQWTSSHDPKNLAMSIAIEAAELMEHFQWGERAAYRAEQLEGAVINEIRLEVADVMIYLLSFCRTLNIDLAQAVLDKVAINETRWPLE